MSEKKQGNIILEIMNVSQGQIYTGSFYRNVKCIFRKLITIVIEGKSYLMYEDFMQLHFVKYFSCS